MGLDTYLTALSTPQATQQLAGVLSPGVAGLAAYNGQLTSAAAANGQNLTAAASVAQTLAQNYNALCQLQSLAQQGMTSAQAAALTNYQEALQNSLSSYTQLQDLNGRVNAANTLDAYNLAPRTQK